MKPVCALCGRLTLQPAVLLRGLPIGPKCAKAAGLLSPRFRRSVVVIKAPVRRGHVPAGETLELFEEVAA